MAGHSKWAQIKRMKAVKDQKRGLAFSKLSALIAVVVREGGGITDPDKNMRLRVLVEKAKYANMPKENINRAIERASSKDAQLQKEVIFEVIGKEGIMLIVVGSTDNNNRTFGSVRYIVEKNGYKMGVAGAVTHHFLKVGEIVFDKSSLDDETALGLAQTYEADELLDAEDEWHFLIPFVKMGKIKFSDSPYQPKSISTSYRPILAVEISEVEAEKAAQIVEQLEELDEIVVVFTNIK